MLVSSLLEFERATGGTPESREARVSGEEYLRKRSLFRRLTTGQPANEKYLSFTHPNRWHYDVLRALDYFRTSSLLTGVPPDPRLGESIDHVRSRRLEDGTRPLDWVPEGRSWFDVDGGEYETSRWTTLRTLRTLRWWDGKSEAFEKNFSRFLDLSDVFVTPGLYVGFKAGLR